MRLIHSTLSRPSQILPLSHPIRNEIIRSKNPTIPRINPGFNNGEFDPGAGVGAVAHWHAGLPAVAVAGDVVRAWRTRSQPVEWYRDSCRQSCRPLWEAGWPTKRQSAPWSRTSWQRGWQQSMSSPRRTGRQEAKWLACLEIQRLAALRSQSFFWRWPDSPASAAAGSDWGPMNPGMKG